MLLHTYSVVCVCVYTTQYNKLLPIFPSQKALDMEILPSLCLAWYFSFFLSLESLIGFQTTSQEQEANDIKKHNIPVPGCSVPEFSNKNKKKKIREPGGTRRYDCDQHPIKRLNDLTGGSLKTRTNLVREAVSLKKRAARL